MELERSSPYPQVPAICPYLEPTPSSPYDPRCQMLQDSNYHNLRNIYGTVHEVNIDFQETFIVQKRVQDMRYEPN
jgi:hypothetical protein